jgi:hypothetical protein
MILGTPLDSCLDPGEQLVWSGRPKQGVRLQAGDVFMIPFSLMWGGFAFFWEASVLGLTPLTNHQHVPAHGGAPLFMALWGIPFCVIGLYIIFGRFFFDAYARGKTCYGVTDRRVIVLKSAFSTNINSIDYINLTNLNLVERKDNSGDILFGMPGPWGNMAGAGGWPTSRRYPQTPGFYLLPQARTVYNLIRDLQQKARTSK